MRLFLLPLCQRLRQAVEHDGENDDGERFFTYHCVTIPKLARDLKSQGIAERNIENYSGRLKAFPAPL